MPFSPNDQPRSINSHINLKSAGTPQVSEVRAGYVAPLSTTTHLQATALRHAETAGLLPLIMDSAAQADQTERSRGSHFAVCRSCVDPTPCAHAARRVPGPSAKGAMKRTQLCVADEERDLNIGKLGRGQVVAS